MSDINDRDVFEAAMASEPVPNEPKVEAPKAVETVVETKPEVNRDETGRFAPKEQAPAEPSSPNEGEPARQEEKFVPSHRLREEAEARRKAEEAARSYEDRFRALEQQLANARNGQPVEPPAPPPSIWENEQAWIQSHLQPVAHQVTQMRVQMSKRLAVIQHGEETVSNAYRSFVEAVNNGDFEAARIAESVPNLEDPFDNVVKWHKKHQALQVIGNDPEAYKKKLLDDPEFLSAALEAARAKAGNGQTQAQAPAPAFNLPPSLNSSRGSAMTAPNLAAMSDADIFSAAMGKK